MPLDSLYKCLIFLPSSRNPESGKSLLESMLLPNQEWYDTDRTEGLNAAPPSRKSSVTISDIVERAEAGKD